MPHVVPIEDERSTTPTQRNTPLLARETRVLGGRYQVRRLLGRGGMANVFLGDDLILERAVAIKILHTHLADDSSGLERFRREAMTLAAVRSPHVVGIYDIGLDGDGGVFIVMQHVEGPTIEEEIVRTGPMSNARATAVLTQLLDGLAEVHSLGVVHRDIKPSNVILGTSDHVVLLDLGIALDPRRAPLTAPGMVAGTPGYLAPESRTRAESDYASDVYQVGLLMLFLLTGVDFARRCPMKGVADLLDRLPPSLAFMARRALATDPSDRFPSASVMREALELRAPSPPPVTSTPKRARTARQAQPPLAREPVLQLEGPTVELVALSDTAPAIKSAIGESRARTIKTTALQAAQILSVQPETCASMVDFDTVQPTQTRLPIASLRQATATPPRGKIMIVDEDVAFCRTLQRMLKAHDTLIANTPGQALAHLGSDSCIDVILCGLATPGLFHSAVLKTYPQQAGAIIFLTGGSATRETRAFVARMANKCLGRPFDLALLRRLIDDCLEAREVS